MIARPERQHRHLSIGVTMTLREALKATDVFMNVADAEQGYESGVGYRDALKGILAAFNASRKDRVHVLRAFDRLERYRSYCNRKSLIERGLILPNGQRISLMDTRMAFAAQSKVLARIYSGGL